MLCVAQTMKRGSADRLISGFKTGRHGKAVCTPAGGSSPAATFSTGRSKIPIIKKMTAKMDKSNMVQMAG